MGTGAPRREPKPSRGAFFCITNAPPFSTRFPLAKSDIMSQPAPMLNRASRCNGQPQKNQIRTTMTHSTESLTTALEAIQSLDALDLVEEFRAFKHSCTPGSYCALVLDPARGETHTVNEASWCCSKNEYFRESGVLSRTTLLSGTREHWNPSPDDGFEHDADGEDYVSAYDDHSDWITAEAYEDLDEEEKKEFTEWFSVSDTPVNGWVSDGRSDYEVRELESRLAELASSIREELKNAEASEA